MWSITHFSWLKEAGMWKIMTVHILSCMATRFLLRNNYQQLKRLRRRTRQSCFRTIATSRVYIHSKIVGMHLVYSSIKEKRLRGKPRRPWSYRRKIKNYFMRLHRYTRMERSFKLMTLWSTSMRKRCLDMHSSRCSTHISWIWTLSTRRLNWTSLICLNF